MNLLPAFFSFWALIELESMPSFQRSRFIHSKSPPIKQTQPSQLNQQSIQQLKFQKKPAVILKFSFAGLVNWLLGWLVGEN